MIGIHNLIKFIFKINPRIIYQKTCDLCKLMKLVCKTAGFYMHIFDQLGSRQIQLMIRAAKSDKL